MNGRTIGAARFLLSVSRAFHEAIAAGMMNAAVCGRAIYCAARSNACA